METHLSSKDIKRNLKKALIKIEYDETDKDTNYVKKTEMFEKVTIHLAPMLCKSMFHE